MKIMKEHYYGFVELTSEELTDIQGGENFRHGTTQ